MIEKCSEYNVRVMKTPDFKNKVHGYNFSYPVMNTIDICDLLISGGTTEVAINGKSKSIFDFDMENKKLTITEKGNKKSYIIEKIELTISKIAEYPTIGHKGRVAETFAFVVLNTPFIIVYIFNRENLKIVSILDSLRRYP